MVNVSCLCHVGLAPRVNASLWAVAKRSKVIRIRQHLCGVLMELSYLQLVSSLSSCVVRLFLCISLISSNIGCMKAIFSFLALSFAGDICYLA